MTQDATPTEAEEQRKPLFVWWSTEESVRDGVPSVLACIEVLLAIVAYWAIAIHFETFKHLWISICIAPLLLMRSDQSIALGVRWYEAFWRKFDETSDLTFYRALRSPDFWLGSIFGAIVTAIYCVYAIRAFSFPDGSIWLKIVGSLLFAFLGLVVGLSVMAATPFGSHAVFGAPPFLSWLGTFANIVGALLRAMAIRFAATACYAWRGFREIPKNFYQTLFVVDVVRPAELVPGFKSNTILTRSDEISRFVSGWRGRFRPILVATLFLILFIPAYGYRLSIKSTCWIYLPLVYIASERDLAFSPLHLLDRLMRSPWERGRRWLALGTLMGFILAVLIFNLTKLPELITAKFVSPIEYFFVLDFPWKKPWQVFNLLSATITLYLWFEVGALRIDLKHAVSETQIALVGRKSEQLKFCIRARNVSSIILILILTVHALLMFDAFGAHAWLPTYIWRGLSSFYGEYIPAPPY